MNPPSKSYETKETPILEVYDTTELHELHQLIDSTLEALPFLGVRSSASVEAHQPLAPTDESSTIQSEKNPMDVGSKRLSEPFFLKKILLENSSGDTSELTTLAMSVHAVMLESGFILINHVSSDDKFRFSKELLSVSLRYTFPELVESVTVTFQSLINRVVVYGSLSGNVRRVYLDTDRFCARYQYSEV